MTRKNHSVIFIGNVADNYSKNKFNYSSKNRYAQWITANFLLPPKELPKRVFNSFLPPIFLQGKPCKVYVDFLGPVLAFLSLNTLLHFGHAYKSPSAAVGISPFKVLSLYSIAMPVISYLFALVCKANVKFSEILALLGYALYGHIFTIGFSLIFYDEASNLFFTLCLIVFSGLSTLRVALVLLIAIPKPICRLLLCSIVSIVQILMLLFFHFVYMHRTFAYATKLDT